METYRRHKKVPDPRACLSDILGPSNLEKDGKSWLRNLYYLSPDAPPSLVEKHRQMIGEIEWLFRHFNSPVVFGARFRAPCPVWRSERIVLRDGTLPRFATRVCIYHGDPKFMSDGDLVKQIDEIGGFLGFVSLRPIRSESKHSRYVAVAHITCPSHMKRPRYHVISTALGPPDAIMPFRGTPYYRPWVDGNMPYRATCLHASLYSALLLKSSTFHCSPVSSHDLLAILWNLRNDNPAKPKAMKSIAQDGLNLEDCLKVLEMDELNAGGCLESVAKSEFLHEALALARVKSGKGRALKNEKHLPTDYYRVEREVNLTILKALKIDQQQLLDARKYINEPASASDESKLAAACADLFTVCDPGEFVALGASLKALADLIKKHVRRPTNDNEVTTAGLYELIRALRKKEFAKRKFSTRLAQLTYSQIQAAKREARLCIAEYLANGMPVIGSISDRQLQEEEDVTREGHSVLIVGMHFQNPTPGKEGGVRPWLYEKSDAFLPSSFVVHDIKEPPFWEVSSGNLLTSGWSESYDHENNQTDFGFNYLAIAPHGARNGIRGVRKRADSLVKAHLIFQADQVRRYERSFGLGELTRERLCLRTHLLNIHEISRRYIKPVSDRRDPSEDELEKVNGYAEALKLLRDQVDNMPCYDPKQRASKKKQSRWWCVECHSETYRSSSFRN